MGKSHEKFLKYQEEGRLLDPTVVGEVVAGIAVCRKEGLRQYSGTFINWNDNEIKQLL